MNTELLLKVKAAILAKPSKFDQSSYCGTEFCIAGHAVAIAEPKLWAKAVAMAESGDEEGSNLVAAASKKLLGLDREQWASLCVFSSDWPEPFASQHRKAKTAKGRARAAANRIDHLIQTGSAK